MNINFQQPLMLISLQYMSFGYAIKLIFSWSFYRFRCWSSWNCDRKFS